MGRPPSSAEQAKQRNAKRSHVSVTFCVFQRTSWTTNRDGVSRREGGEDAQKQGRDPRSTHRGPAALRGVRWHPILGEKSESGRGSWQAAPAPAHPQGPGQQGLGRGDAPVPPLSRACPAARRVTTCSC